MKTKPKIAIIAPYWRPANISGTEVFNETVYKVLSTKYDVTVITSDSYGVRYFRDLINNRCISSTNNIIRLRHNPLKTFIRYFTNPRYEGPTIDSSDLYKTLNDGAYSGVYLSSIPHELNIKTIKAIQLLKNRPRIYMRPNYHPEIYTERDNFHKYILKKVFTIHVWTKAEKKALQKRFSISSRKIKVMNPPFIRTRAQETVKQVSHIAKVNILYAGEKNEHKGIYSLIDALKRINSRNIELITIGPHNWKWEMYKYINRLSFLKDLGYVSHKTKEKLFAECDIFCLPSHADSFGFAYLDAWRYKKPVIAADTPVMREVIGKGGLFVDRNNPEDFSHTLKKLIDNRELREQLGKTGFTSLQRFSYHKNLKSFLKLFKL